MSLTHLLKYQVKNPTLISFHALYDNDKISNDKWKDIKRVNWWHDRSVVTYKYLWPYQGCNSI